MSPRPRSSRHPRRLPAGAGETAARIDKIITMTLT